MKDKSRSLAIVFGIEMADAVMNAAHLTYNTTRGRVMINTCIERLKERVSEIQPKKSDPRYKKARYG